MKPTTFAALLRQHIDGKPVAQVAADAGMSRAAIYHLLNGTRTDPPWSTVQAIAKSLGISTDSLRTY